MMNILVTGGAGFIASHLIEALLGEGHSVVAVDNFRLGKPEFVDRFKAHPTFRFYELDMLDRAGLQKIFHETAFNMVFHLAANSDISKSHDDPDVDLNNTFLTTYNLLFAMKHYAVKNLLFASSSAIYGEVLGEITEEHGPLLPKSHYGAAKLASEAFISSFVENYGMTAWLVRFPNVVGPRLTHGVVYDFIKKLERDPENLLILGDGQQQKPYVDVRDLIQAMLLIWKNSHDRVNYFNVGVSSATRVDDIAQFVIQAMKLQPHIAYTGGATGWVGDIPRFEYNVEKIRNLGWSARFNSDEAILHAVASNVPGAKESPTK